MERVVTYDLQKRLVQFAASIISNQPIFIKGFATEHLLKQLIRSTTGAALNYGEAQSAESKRDFVHKMKICLKELRESQVNLEIMKEAKLVDNLIEFDNILKESSELVAIFTASLKTTQTKM